MMNDLRCPHILLLSVSFLLSLTTWLPAQTVIYVDDDAPGPNDGSSWTDAFRDLQDALAIAQYGDEIRVAQGTYTPDRGSGNRLATFQLVNGVALRGGYAGYGAFDPDERDIAAYETVLSGDLLGNDGPEFTNNSENSFHVIISDYIDNVWLEGITISGGNANGPIHNDGGGIQLRVPCNGNVILKQCDIRENYAQWGAGLDASGNLCGGMVVISDCKFTNNLAESHGGAIFDYHAIFRIENSIFTNNASDRSCGAIYQRSGFPTFANCAFIENHANEKGGAICVYHDRPVITNCTFYNNDAYEGGAIYMSQFAWPRISITNSILWNNQDQTGMGETAQITAISTFPFLISYSTIQGWSGQWGGIWNNSNEPVFADDYGRLSAGSPCIDSGDNEALPGDVTTDLDGNPRFLDDPMTDDHGNGTPPIVDRGAFEFQDVCDWQITPDCDGDDVLNGADNCPYKANADQGDFDDDGAGDVCDDDIDGDGVPNDRDVCDFSPPTVVIEANGTSRSDLDGDCDVDLVDFAVWQNSLSGPR